MTFTVENLEVYLAVAMRISGFVFSAPFFSLKDVPQKVKLLLSFAVALIVYFVVPYEPLVYEGVIGYARLIISEALAGVVLGLFANLAMYILSFAGQLADMEIGFSMMMQMDPSSGMQVTITSNILTYAVTLMMIVTNMHLYILKAIIDSFVLVPLGNVTFSPFFYQGYLNFILFL